MIQAQIIYDDVRDLPNAFTFLQDAPPASGGVLSVFLDTSFRRVPGRDYLVFFRNSTRAVRTELAASESDQLKDFDLAVERVEEFVLHFAPRHPGLALYASVDPEYFVAVPLPGRPVQDVAWSRQPVLTPLIEMMDEYEHVAVALVDKREARLFMTYLGAIELYESIESDSTGKYAPGDFPRRTRSTGIRGGRSTPGKAGMIAWSGMAQSRQRRRHEEFAMQHLRDVAQALMQMMHEQPFDRLFLAGTEEAVDMLRNNLPQPLKARFAESLPLPVTASESEVLTAALEASQRREREAEVETVERLVERAGTGGAVLGLEETLNAVNDGRVDTLVMNSNLSGAVSMCGNCGRLTTSTSTCPSCGSEIEEVPDLRERLALDVLDQSGRIEIVEGPAADLLDSHNVLGAYVRY
jgi:peptide subunit release factor 1 (eRF1)